MRTSILVLSLMLLVSGCNLRRDNDNTLEWKAPTYPNIEAFAITSFSKEPWVSRPNYSNDIWRKRIPFFIGPFLDHDPHFSSTDFEYIGTESGRDHYKVTLNYGERDKEKSMEIVYSGTEIEVFQYSDCTTGLRPFTKQ